MVAHSRSVALPVTIAGLAAGLAEAVWVMLYGSLASVDGRRVAREVITTVYPGLAAEPIAPYSGMALHFALSIAIAWVFYLVLASLFASPRRSQVLLVSVCGLAGIWAMNFFWILPNLNPAMANAVPKALSLVSKLSFGTVMGLALPLDSSPRHLKGRTARPGARQFPVWLSQSEGITHGR